MVEEKPWYLSKTIWGSLVAVAASLAGIAGVPIEAGAQGQIADALVQAIGAVGALVAIYGRLTATNVIV